MAAGFVATLIRLKQEGYRPDRDLVLVLETDEESADSDRAGITWLLKNHRDLLDAEYALNEGGGLGLKEGRAFEMDFQAGWRIPVPAQRPGGSRSPAAAGEVRQANHPASWSTSLWGRWSSPCPPCP